MVTVNYAVKATSTSKRFRTDLLSAVDSISDVNVSGVVTAKLDKGQSIILAPTKLLLLSSNGVKILIRITIGVETITLPVTTNLCIPFDADNVSVEIKRPSDDGVDLPAVVSYVTV